MSRRGLRPLALLTGALLALAGCAPTAEPASAPAPAPSATPGGATTAVAPGAPGAALVPPAAAVADPSAADPLVLEPSDVPAPTALGISSIGVATELLVLGLAADGTAAVPEDFARAGWFAPGGRPGARGPTVLMGHVDSATGPAVFADLHELRAGDTVEVTVADGTVALYVVTGTEQVAKSTFPTTAVFGATTQDVLRLITCSGGFDRDASSYLDNLVVSAVRVS